MSPFMPMDVSYDWAFSPPTRRLGVTMSCTRDGAKVFFRAYGFRK